MKKLLTLALLLAATFSSQDVQAAKSVKTPEYLYKVVSVDQWQGSLQRNRLVSSYEDGEFTHFATEHQLFHVLGKYWKKKDHVIVKVNPKKIEGSLVVESEEAMSFYDLFEGTIPLDAVESFTVVYS